MLLTENNYYSPFDAAGGSVTVGVQRSALPSESEIEGKSNFFFKTLVQWIRLLICAYRRLLQQLRLWHN